MSQRETQVRLGSVDPTAKGWPRRWLPWTGRAGRNGITVDTTELKPVPWINGDSPANNDWLFFPEERSLEAYNERACVVCGERMEGIVVFGSATEGRRETAGPGGHPRCLLLAAQTCPNLLRKTGDEPVAWLYCGDGRGHTSHNEEPYSDGVQPIDDCAIPLSREELKALARRDPMGVGVDA